MGDGRQFGDGLQHAVSLIAAMIDTSTVSGVSAFASAVGSIRPSRSTGRYLTWTPCSRCGATAGLQNSGMLAGLGDDLRRRGSHGRGRRHGWRGYWPRIRWR